MCSSSASVGSGGGTLAPWWPGPGFSVKFYVILFIFIIRKTLMEMGDRLDQLDAIQSAVFVQIVHVEVVELQLFWRHMCGGIHFALQVLFYMA